MQPGFMIFINEWDIEDFSSAEVGDLLKALFRYFLTGEYTEFADRSLKQFYRRAVRSIEEDRKRYEDRCLKNAYNRYCGTCRQKGEAPEEYAEWLKDPDGRQRSSTIVTNTNTNTNTKTNTNTNTNTSTNTNTNTKARRSSGSAESSAEDAFEARRSAFLSSLTELRSSSQ